MLFHRKLSFHLIANGPHGMTILPDQGPILHTASDWNRPGDEWGTSFIFPAPGCWNVHATRPHAFGDMWLAVE